jgi:hypothetical protein
VGGLHKDRERDANDEKTSEDVGSTRGVQESSGVNTCPGIRRDPRLFHRKALKNTDEECSGVVAYYQARCSVISHSGCPSRKRVYSLKEASIDETQRELCEQDGKFEDNLVDVKELCMISRRIKILRRSQHTCKAPCPLRILGGRSTSCRPYPH